MAIENVVANAGSGGAKFATDRITEGVDTLEVPYCKLMSGADGAKELIGGDAAFGLDVDVTRVSGTVTVAGTVTANAGSGTFSVDSELPAAAALADAAANPTAPAVGAFPHVFNGTSWDRARGDSTNGLDVDVTRVSGNVTVVQSSAANLLMTVGAALPAGNNNIGDVDIASALPAGSNLIGRVNPEPSTAGGLLIGRRISTADTNAVSLKASAGQVYTIYAHNVNAAVRYLKLYNKASAPTVGTDTPVMTIPIPGNSAGAGVVLDTGGMGIEFGTGIAYALTTGVADTDTGAVAANEIVVHILYK